MSKLLRARLELWHLLVVFAVLALGGGGVAFAQGSDPHRLTQSQFPEAKAEGFLPAGTFYMATASKSDQVYYNADGLEHETLKATFAVPSGKKADIVAFFNASAYKEGTGFCYVKFRLDSMGGTVLNPGELGVADGDVFADNYPTLAAQGFRKNVSSGAHTLYVTIRSTESYCEVENRSLIVLANVH